MNHLPSGEIQVGSPGSMAREVCELKAEVDRLTRLSDGRLKVLTEKAQEANDEWHRAEVAEGHLDRLRQGITHIRDHAGRHPGESLEAIRALCEELLA